MSATGLLIDQCEERANMLQTKLDSSNAKIKMLTEAMENIASVDRAYFHRHGTEDGVNNIIGVAKQAIASTDTERYKLEQAVIEAVNAWMKSDDINVVPEDYVLEKAFAKMQEHNNAGEES